MRFSRIVVIVMVIVTAPAALVFAQGFVPLPGPSFPTPAALGGEAAGIEAILNRVVNWLFALLLLLASLFIIIAAYKYLTAAGDPEKAKEATKMITYAIIAIIVGFLARAIVFIVKELIGV